VEVSSQRPGGARRVEPLLLALSLLTLVTGLVDAACYLGLGRVFTANMTGNIVLLGFGIAGSGGLPVVAPLISLAAFLLGSAGGGQIVKRTADRHPVLVVRALAVEVALIGVAVILAAAATIRPGDGGAYAMIFVLAFAMGVRNAAVRRMGVPDLTTTVLTMTLTALASESPFGGGAGTGSTRRLAAVMAMLLGALAGALLLKTELYLPLLVAAVLALVTWIVYVPAAVRRGSP
jgi:uncharacterized membrane protein YoaK (UPF0700 family)